MAGGVGKNERKDEEYGGFRMKGDAIEILLVEDNPGDVRLVKEVMKDAKVANSLHVAEDGEEAMAMLRREGKYIGSVRPDLSFWT